MVARDSTTLRLCFQAKRTNEILFQLAITLQDNAQKLETETVNNEDHNFVMPGQTHNIVEIDLVHLTNVK